MNPSERDSRGASLPTSPARAERSGLRPDDGRLARGRRTRARLREAARALFRERGFDAATLRAIAARAGMGTSSIYRHVRSKEELLVEELAALQEEAWLRFRSIDRSGETRARLERFLDLEHARLAEDPDFTTIALRALTHPEARVARRVLALQDREVGLLAEILQRGRIHGDLARGTDVLVAARTLFFAALGARIAWANGQIAPEDCRRATRNAVALLFDGIGARRGASRSAPRVGPPQPECGS